MHRIVGRSKLKWPLAQDSSAGSSSEIPYCGFIGLSSAWRSVFRVFLYHQAAATPPAKAEAAAIKPTLSHPDEMDSSVGGVVEESDSKVFVTYASGPHLGCSDLFHLTAIWALDAGNSVTITL
jgi:hypothetical protein